MKLAGRLAVTVGAVVFIIALVLPYTHSRSVWQISNREGVLLTLVALVALALAVVTFFLDAPVLVLVQAAVGPFLFGEFFPLGLGTYSQTGAGFWLGTVATLAMATGGGLSIVAVWPKGGWRPTTGRG